MIKKRINCIIGILILSIVTGPLAVTAIAAKIDFPDSDATGKITLHSYDVNDFENLKESTGEKLDQENLPATARKQEGIVFTLQRLDDSDGSAVSVSTPADPAFTEQEGKTDAGGELIFADLPKGYYLITEQVRDGYSVQQSPFIVMLPMKKNRPDGMVEWNYDVHVYPKHMVNSQIKKQPEQEGQVVGVGDEVVWNINYEVGADIKKETAGGTIYAKDFYIYDTLDSRLTYLAGSAVFQLYDKEDNMVELDFTKEVHYTEAYDQGKNTISWKYTEQGVRVLADSQIGKVQVSIKTAVNSSAIGTAAVIWNNAAVDFINASGDPYHLDVFDMDSDKNGADVPKVYLGSIAIDKYERGNSDKKLANVTFKIADTEQNAEAGIFIKIADKEYEITTDEQGYGIFTAIGNGDYWLVETAAAPGYRLSEKPVKVTIGSNPTEANVIAAVENELVKGTAPPTNENKDNRGKIPGLKTGDIANIFLMAAILGIAAAAMLGLRKRRRADSDGTEKAYNPGKGNRK